MGVKCSHCGTYTYNEPYNGLSLVTCLNCHLQFVVFIDKAVWPLTSPKAPDSVPEKVKEAYDDARLAHAAGANIGALMAGRTAAIRFLRDKGVTKFKQLVEQRIITPALYGGVDQLRAWAAIAGHEDTEVGTFSGQEVEDILDYLATVLEAVYTHQARVDEYVHRTQELKGQLGHSNERLGN